MLHKIKQNLKDFRKSIKILEHFLINLQGPKTFNSKIVRKGVNKSAIKRGE